MSVGSAFGSLTALFIVGGVWIGLGVALVKVEIYANTMDLPQDSYNFIGWMNIAWWAGLVVLLVLIVLNHWLNSKSEGTLGSV